MYFQSNYILCSERSCSTISGLLGLQAIDSGHLPYPSKEGQVSNLSATHPVDGRPQVRLIFAGMTSHDTVRICGAHKRPQKRLQTDLTQSTFSTQSTFGTQSIEVKDARFYERSHRGRQTALVKQIEDRPATGLRQNNDPLPSTDERQY